MRCCGITAAKDQRSLALQTGYQDRRLRALPVDLRKLRSFPCLGTCWHLPTARSVLSGCQLSIQTRHLSCMYTY